MNPNFNPFLNNFNINQNQNFNNFYPNIPAMNINNFQYPFPMMQMNQMIIPYMNYQMNNNINQNQNINNPINMNYNFKNQNQKKLVDEIIEFYQKNGRRYMNYNEPNQIKKLLDNLDVNSPNLKEGNDIEDPLSYIHEKKKLIKFINQDSKIINVLVPISINKETLYQIARLYKASRYHSKILLIYANCILNENYEPIDNISDDDYIIIIENKYYLDDSYFNSFRNINNLNKSTRIKNVKIKLNSNIIPLFVSNGTKLSEIIKALIFYLSSDYFFVFNGQKYNEEIISNRKNDMEIPYDNITIECYSLNIISGDGIILGKKINLKIACSDDLGTNFNYLRSNYCSGLLNSIKNLIELIELQNNVKVKKVYLEQKEINFKEDKSLASLGIKNDSTLILNIN